MVRIGHQICRIEIIFLQSCGLEKAVQVHNKSCSSSPFNRAGPLLLPPVLGHAVHRSPRRSTPPSTPGEEEDDDKEEEEEEVAVTLPPRTKHIFPLLEPNSTLARVEVDSPGLPTG